MVVSCIGWVSDQVENFGDGAVGRPDGTLEVALELGRRLGRWLVCKLHGRDGRLLTDSTLSTGSQWRIGCAH